jgi:hypothetical protein
VNLELTERCAMKSESSIVGFSTGSRAQYRKLDRRLWHWLFFDELPEEIRHRLHQIAKQLVDGIAINDTDAQIVQAIIMMATALNCGPSLKRRGRSPVQVA